jgi:hypothetical protein
MGRIAPRTPLDVLGARYPLAEQSGAHAVSNARGMRINDEDFPTLAELAERLELRELEWLARMMVALWTVAGCRADLNSLGHSE